MTRRAFLQFGLGLGLTGVAALAAMALPQREAVGALQWVDRTLNALGTSMTLRAAHADAGVAGRALDAAVADIRAIEDQMSLFRADSALCQLNRSGQLDHVPPDLLALFTVAQDVARRSQGAFDVTVQPLWLAFEQARQQGRLPTRAEVREARQRVGWRGLEVGARGVRLQRPGMGVTLNGIAQGFAADKVKARLQAFGIEHALIDAGEWASLGQPSHAGDWTLGVANPRDAHRLVAGIALQGRCVATSADDQCSFSPDFVHHHIFDPRTGYSPRELSSVSVMAPTAVMADALTKVIFMAGFDRALPLARAWGVEVLVVDKQGRWKASAGLPLRPV
jgi:thiamine biosynthesis lipoprotein